MATALNAAAAEKKAMDAEAAAQEIRVLEAKRAAVNDMLSAVCDYLVAAGEGDLVGEVKDIDTDKVIEMLDGSIEMAKSLEKLKSLEFPMFGVNGPVAKPKVKVTNADEAIGDFLKSFGL